MARDYNEDNPGPGAYHANYKFTRERAPKHTFGLNTAIWFDYDKPGPGTYNLRKDANSAPKYTMADRFKRPAGLNVPGPGTYKADYKHTVAKAPSFTMQGPTMYNPDRGVPGPGTYDLRDPLPVAGPTIGQKLFFKANEGVGPGAYSPVVPWGGPSHTIGQRWVHTPFPTPGPGTYRARSAEFDGPMYSMGRRFYRLRDRKKERRYMAVLQHRPQHTRPSTPQGESHRVLVIVWCGGVFPSFFLLCMVGVFFGVNRTKVH